jgi:hypothetical protein
VNIGQPNNVTMGNDPNIGELVIEIGPANGSSGMIMGDSQKTDYAPQTIPVMEPDWVAVPRMQLDELLLLVRDIHRRVNTPWYLRLYKWVKQICGLA